MRYYLYIYWGGLQSSSALLLGFFKTAFNHYIQIGIGKLWVKENFRAQESFVSNVHIKWSFCYSVLAIVYFHIPARLFVKSSEFFSNIWTCEAKPFFHSFCYFHGLFCWEPSNL